MLDETVNMNLLLKIAIDVTWVLLWLTTYLDSVQSWGQRIMVACVGEDSGLGQYMRSKFPSRIPCVGALLAKVYLYTI